MRYLSIAATALLLVAGGLVLGLRPPASERDGAEQRRVVASTAAAGSQVARQSPAGSGRSRLKPTSVVPRDVARAFAAFRGSAATSRAAVTVEPLLAEASKLQAQEATEAPQIDYARAVPVDVSGTSLRAWIAPAGKKVCAVVEIPDGAGTGGACSTPEQVRRGDGLTIVPLQAAGERQVIVLQIVVDGQDPGHVEVAGKARAIGAKSANGNAVAGTFPAVGEVRSGDLALPLEAIREP